MTYLSRSLVGPSFIMSVFIGSGGDYFDYPPPKSVPEHVEFSFEPIDGGTHTHTAHLKSCDAVVTYAYSNGECVIKDVKLSGADIKFPPSNTLESEAVWP